jgi:hypothetical protein
MRCGLQPILRILRYALPIVLMLTAAPSASLAQSVCDAIRRGESATQVARRLTGDGRNAYQPWFQVLNASSRSIPKSQYNRIRAGWTACAPRTAVQRGSSRTARVTSPDSFDTADDSAASEAPETVTAPPAIVRTASVDSVEDADSAQPVEPDIVGTIGVVDLTMVWLGAAMIVPWLGWRVLDDYLARRRTASIVIRHFAHRFVDEFERPLVRYQVGEHPVRSRLRRGARRGRFDILLAPGEGRRYPNLSDHKKNVEYDVSRVMHVLADASFVSGPPYTQSGWIVVPFQFRSGPKQPGVTCISSF